MKVPIACICPPKAGGAPRHSGDTVTIADVLDFRRTIVVRQSLGLGYQTGEVEGLPEMQGLLLESYLLNCIDAWTLVDEKGAPVPVSRAAVRERLLSRFDEAEKVGNAADELYTATVILPLLTRVSSSSSDSPIVKSTSAASTTGTKPRRPSKRSSTTTTRMDATVTMAASPAGGSSSSLR